MKQLYQHTYQSGRKITLSVEFVDDALIFASPTKKVEDEDKKEYEMWVEQVVCADLLERSTPEQKAILAWYGISLMGKANEGNPENNPNPLLP